MLLLVYVVHYVLLFSENICEKYLTADLKKKEI